MPVNASMRLILAITSKNLLVTAPPIASSRPAQAVMQANLHRSQSFALSDLNGTEGAYPFAQYFNLVLHEKEPHFKLVPRYLVRLAFAGVCEIKAIATSDNKSKVGFIFRLWLRG